jgi:hypothetical protein
LSEEKGKKVTIIARWVEDQSKRDRDAGRWYIMRRIGKEESEKEIEED